MTGQQVQAWVLLRERAPALVRVQEQPVHVPVQAQVHVPVQAQVPVLVQAWVLVLVLVQGLESAKRLAPEPGPKQGIEPVPNRALVPVSALGWPRALARNLGLVVQREQRWAARQRLGVEVPMAASRLVNCQSATPQGHCYWNLNLAPKKQPSRHFGAFRWKPDSRPRRLPRLDRHPPEVRCRRHRLLPRKP